MRFLRSLFGDSRSNIDPDVLLRFGSTELSASSLESGIAAIGATGSGKTSFLELLLQALAQHPSRPGILHCCVKNDEADRAEKIARKAGRSGDFLRVTADGRCSLDLFSYLLGPLGQTSEEIARFLDRLAGLAVGNFGSGPDKIWSVQSSQLIGKGLDLFQVAGERPTPMSLFEVLVSVPRDPAIAASNAFLTDTACGRLIVRAQLRKQAGLMNEEEKVVFTRAVEYVMSYLCALGDRFLGSIIGSAVTGLGQLLQPPFDKIFTGPSTWTPDCLTEGAYVALDLPAISSTAAAVAQSTFVQLVQLYLLHTPRGRRRPVVIVRDEAQFLVVPEWDCKVQSVARSHGIISVTAVQGLPQMVAAFGGSDNARVQAEAFLSGHATMAVFNPAADAETREHFVKLFGTTRQLFYSASSQPNPNPDMIDQLLGVTHAPSVSWGEQVHPTVSERDLTSLRRGGVLHDFQVEAFLFQAGRKFPNGHPFTRIIFSQDLSP